MAELKQSPGHKSQIELFKSARPDLARLLHLYRVPPSDAEGILSEVQLLLLYRWDSLEDPKSWLIHAVRSRCIAHRRKRRRGLAEAVDAAILDLLPASPGVEADGVRRDLEKFLSGLPPRCRAYLRQRYGLAEAGGGRPRGSAGPSEDSAGRCLEMLADRLLQLDPEPTPVERGENTRQRTR